MDMALLDILVPFFFIFAVAYGGLEASAVIKNKKANLLIALMLGLVAMSNPMTVGFINQILPYGVIAFAVVFFIGFVLSFLRGKGGSGGGSPDYVLIIIIAALVLLFFASDNPVLGSFSGFEFAQWGVLAMIALVFLAAYKKA